MADNASEFGEGRGRTGYRRDLRNYEILRLQRATDPAEATDNEDAALARELAMEKRSRTNDAGRELG